MGNNTNYINWNGSTEQSSPHISTEAEEIVWGQANFTWEDFQLLGKITTARRKKTLDDYLLRRPEEKEKLVRLICKVKGIKVYDEQKAAKKMKISTKDIDLLIKEMFGKIIVQ